MVTSYGTAQVIPILDVRIIIEASLDTILTRRGFSTRGTWKGLCIRGNLKRYVYTL